MELLEFGEAIESKETGRATSHGVTNRCANRIAGRIGNGSRVCITTGRLARNGRDGFQYPGSSGSRRSVVDRWWACQPCQCAPPRVSEQPTSSWGERAAPAMPLGCCEKGHRAALHMHPT